jgi:hypothetical protein
MKKLFSILFLCVTLSVATVTLAPQQAEAAVAVVQSKTVALGTLFSGDGIAELSFDSTTTVGNRILVIVGTAQSSRDITSIVDNGAGGVNTYSEVAGSDLTTGEPGRTWTYISIATAATATQVTVTLTSATAAESMITLLEISGSHASSPVEDISTASTAATTTHTISAVDVANAGSLLVGHMWMEGTGSYTIDSDFTQVHNNARGLSGWDQVDAGSFTMVNTSAGNETGQNVLIAIQPAAAASSGLLRRRRS